MKFTLKSYRDLGRCSMGTLLDEFDTEKDKVIENGKEVPIRSVEDLFPYLWQSPGIAFHSEGKNVSEFWCKGTHWHHDFDGCIPAYEKQIKRLEKKVEKATDPKKKEHYQNELSFCKEQIVHLKAMIERMDNEMEQLKKKLIKENS
ncbi:hypothetical protein [Fibrobacter sp.]|uniref:hypothetical protein n=1 Tax=Fibrobacter sp. TaxID=35828 RepID=UPI003865BB40